VKVLHRPQPEEHPLSSLVLRSIAKRYISKDEAEAVASWFETPASGGLLTMKAVG